MSTLKANTVTTLDNNTDLTITGGGTGVPNLEAGTKLNGTALTSTFVQPSANVPDVAPGTSGNLLTSNGSAWTSAAAAGGGSWTLISTTALTPGNASIDFTGLTSFTHYKFMLDGLRPATDGAVLMVRLSDDNGSTFATSSYTSAIRSQKTTTEALTGGEGLAGIHIGSTSQTPGSASEWGVAEVHFVAPQLATVYGYVMFNTVYSGTANDPTYVEGGGFLKTGTGLDTDAVRFIRTTGNIGDGNISLYGLASS